jgi:hypothetical protein
MASATSAGDWTTPVEIDAELLAGFGSADAVALALLT